MATIDFVHRDLCVYDTTQYFSRIISYQSRRYLCWRFISEKFCINNTGLYYRRVGSWRQGVGNAAVRGLSVKSVVTTLHCISNESSVGDSKGVGNGAVEGLSAVFCVNNIALYSG